jgi:hypothetical protein
MPPTSRIAMAASCCSQRGCDLDADALPTVALTLSDLPREQTRIVNQIKRS